MLGLLEVGCILAICVLHYNIDPLFSFAQFIEKWQKLQSYYKTKFVLRMTRYIITHWLAQIIASGFRTLSVCVIIGGLYKGKFLFWMSNQQLKLVQISLYRQSFIVQRVMHSFDHKASIACFGAASGLVLFGVHVAILGQKFDVTALSVLGLLGILGGTLFLQSFFSVGCAYFENSQEILTRWKTDLAKGSYSKSTRKELQSLKPIAMPAGDVGIIDKDIKINYWDALLGNVVNVILSVNEIY